MKALEFNPQLQIIAATINHGGGWKTMMVPSSKHGGAQWNVPRGQHAGLKEIIQVGYAAGTTYEFNEGQPPSYCSTAKASFTHEVCRRHQLLSIVYDL